MIHNDEQLKVVREQLTRAESALASLRSDVRSTNEKIYQVMSESYVDTILELREQVDSYIRKELPSMNTGTLEVNRKQREKLLADSIEAVSDDE